MQIKLKFNWLAGWSGFVVQAPGLYLFVLLIIYPELTTNPGYSCTEVLHCTIINPGLTSLYNRSATDWTWTGFVHFHITYC